VEPVGSKILLVIDRLSQQIYTQGDNHLQFLFSSSFVFDLTRINSRIFILSLLVGTASQIPTTASRRKIWGLIGTIRLLACRYLVVITDAEMCGTIAGHNIYKISSTDVIPYTRSSLHLTERQVQNNATYLEMIKSVLNTPYFYFSYTYDLSHTMQRLHNTTPEFLQVNIIGSISHRYIA